MPTEPNWTLVGTKETDFKVTAEEPTPTIKLSVDNTNPLPDTKVTATITVVIPKNSQISSATIDLMANNTRIKEFSETSIQSGKTYTYTYAFKPSDLGYKGGDTITLEADGKFQTSTTTIASTSNRVTLTVKQPESLIKPVVSVSVSKDKVNVGETETITAVVKNNNSMPVQTDLYIDITSPDGHTASIRPIPNGFQLQPNESKTVSYDYKPQVEGVYYVKASATFTANGQQVSNESGSMSFQAVSEEQRNVQVTLTVDKTAITTGDTVTATVTIANNSSFAISAEQIALKLDGNALTTKTYSDAIDAGASKSYKIQIQPTAVGTHTLTAEVQATFNDGKVQTFVSNNVGITIEQSKKANFTLKLSYPDEATAGDTVTINMQIINTGQVDIDSGTISYTINQADENGKTIASYSNSITVGAVKVGDTTSNPILIATKNVAGQLSGAITAVMDFHDGTKVTKTANISITLTSSGGNTPGENTKTSGAFGQVLGYIKAHPLVAGGIVAGVFLLMLLGKRSGPSYAYPPAYPPTPAYPPAYPYER